MASLSSADQSLLTAAQQEQIKQLKQQYAAATTDSERQSIHQQAENIRSSAGYSGGVNGAGYSKLAAGSGGQTAAEVEQYLKNYNAENYSDKRGWINGYSTGMNVRSKANYIRQQMDANFQAWKETTDQATRDYLHQQNVELERLIREYAGGAKSSYDPVTGKWSTWNTNIGYGDNAGWTQPNIANAWRQYYGYTDEDRKAWDEDTSRYYNFVDTRVPARNQVDESSGYTGQYAEFVNGPHGYLLGGAPGGALDSNMSAYANVVGDGFHDQYDYAAYRLPTYDENGNIIQTAPALKNNGIVPDYQKQHADYVVNGVIMPGTTSGNSRAVGYTGPAVGKENAGSFVQTKKTAAASTGSGSKGGGSLADSLDQAYDSALQAQLAGLQSSYETNLSELDADAQAVEAAYAEQKRQAAGASAQAAAAWREIANASGLSSGAAGQAALAQRNRLQEDLSTLGAAQAAALAEIQRQRTVLGQQYQAAINEAAAENDAERLQALYEEAVRVEEALREEEQYYTKLFLQYGQKLVGDMGGTVVA